MTAGRSVDFMVKSTKKCARCELQHPIDEEDCMHCGHLNSEELVNFKRELAKNKETRGSLGTKFVIAALVLFSLLFFIS
ncbi:hypothetical protein [Colwellia sp. E150_009]